MAECLNHTLVKRVRAMLHASALPKDLWGEAIMHATWLKNCSSTRHLGTKMPYETLYLKKPNLLNILVWGCHIKVHNNSGSKLDMWACDGWWVGFNLDSNGHCIYWPDTKAVGVEQSVIFKKHDVAVPYNILLEGESGNAQNASAQPHTQPQQRADAAQCSSTEMASQHVKMETIRHSPDTLGTTFKSPPPPPRHSTRQCFESNSMRHLCTGEGMCDGHITLDHMWQLHDTDRSSTAQDNAMLVLIKDELAAGNEDVNTIYTMAAGVETDGLDALTVNKARSGVDWPSWQDAINAKLKSLEGAHTWNLVEHPNGVNVVGCKWVFKIKCNANGEIKKYKAQLVAKGYLQIQGIDYDETYVPVARLVSLRTVLAIAAHNNWDIEVFDFHSAFLNGKLGDGEDIYMELPEGYTTSVDLVHPVAKLNIMLYGSKQGALRWYQELSSTLDELRLKCVHTDWGIFYGWIGHDILVLASHVDNCTVTGSSPKLIHSFKAEIRLHYKITDLGPISWLLGMKVARNQDARTISLSQQAYIEAILTKYNLTTCKPAPVPMDPGLKLSHDQSPQSAEEIGHMKSVPY